MRSPYKKRAIVIINEETGERQEFDSINAAAYRLETNFANVQRAAIYNGVIKGWRVYESPDAIRKHIIELELQLAELEKF